jgi:hypothetical protein
LGGVGVKLSIHPEIRGKPDRDARINLGRGWVTIDADWADAFELITTDGYATSAELRLDHRAESEFVSRQLLMVDIDAGMTIPELLANEFYNIYGAGFYATPSFRPEHHKFRICFLLEQAERDPVRLRKLNRGLLRVFAQADEACKDPTRLFYGTIGCEIRERRDVYLTQDAVETLIDLIDAEIAQQEAERTQYIERDLTDWERNRIIDLLRGSYAGEYTTWRNIGWGLKAGGFALSDFQYVTQGMMSQKTADDARQLWNSGSESGGITMGTVIHFLRQRYGEDCLRDTRTREQRRVAEISERLAKKYGNTTKQGHEDERT